MSSYRVTVTKDYLVFCAGHFITYSGSLCESLHGHNYRTGVTLEGDVNPDHYVYDFVALKRKMREIIEPLDHKMLLPTENPLLELAREEGTVGVRYRDRAYRFPEGDCVLLPIPNTTAEMLARHLAEELVEALRLEGASGLETLEVEVEESPGQSGWYRTRLDGAAGPA